MEGLLPLVYKAIKKHKIRKQMRQYQCLSSEAALSYNINVAELYYPLTQGHDDYYLQLDENIGYLRNNNSTREFSNGFSSSPCAAGTPHSKQLMRFRSHKMFSCLAG